MYKMLMSLVSSMLPSGEAVLSELSNLIRSSSGRKVFRRMIRDLIEDEIKEALLLHSINRKEAELYNKKNKSRLKQEIRSRLDPILQAKT